MSDYENDGYCGFEIVEAREIDTIGTAGIIKKIRDRVGTVNPVYLSIDIDTLDPACKCHPALVGSQINLTAKTQSPLQPALPRPAVGRPANSAPSSAGLMA